MNQNASDRKGEDQASLPEGRQPALRVVAMPEHTNPHGDVFGGWIMAQVDIAGSVPAIECTGGRIVTVAVNSFHFRKPVFPGDLISFYADVIRVGNTSVTVRVEVYAQRTPEWTRCVKVTEAELTYVAVDQEGRPRPIQREGARSENRA